MGAQSSKYSKEIKAQMTQAFKDIDTNNDGKIQFSEFLNRLMYGVNVNQELVKLCFFLLDTNKDDALQQSEFERIFQVMVNASEESSIHTILCDLIDFNGDGFLDQNEIKAMYEFYKKPVPQSANDLGIKITKKKFEEYIKAHFDF
ncbi:calcium-binding_protein [Hexamita inflata]|uniref:Putative n=1 Tax=Hexamita inflata TaxID=28002 RepID=A0AA86V127_9EUKA|nr:calcium-binding protein [Hexamita inflata]